MSFQFNWPDFDPTFYAEAKQQLETALNKEKKSKYIADYIFVKQLNMGSKPPELEILEICELSTDYFRGIFKLTYCGDAFIELKTKIQANPLYSSSPYPHSENDYYRPILPRHSRPSMVTAAQPLVIPMLLRISDVQLNGIIVLSVSKTKGVTLVFKNDTLTRLQVNSTFDIVASIKSYLQQQIESQLRTFLHDTFPLVVHEYSLRHIQNQQQRQQTRPPEPPKPSLCTQDQYTSDTATTIPDLTPSDCYSDTSSDCMSYNDMDVNNASFATPILLPTMSTSHYPIPSGTNDITQPSIPFTKNMYNYETPNFITDRLCQQHYNNSYFTSPSPSRSDPYVHQPPSCVYQYNDDDDNITNISDDQQTHYLDDKTPSSPPSSTIFWDQPILISANASHGLIHHMTDLSTSFQTLAIDIDINSNNSSTSNSSNSNSKGSNGSNNSSSRTFSIHKATIMAGNMIPGHHQRKKIPKRRIIKWNS